MSTPIAPDLKALLEEIPATGTLLRVTPEQLIHGLRETVNRARPTMTGLLPVEAHLLAVHREELAHVLLEECILRLYKDEAAHSRFNWTATPPPTRDGGRVGRALEHGESLLPELALGRKDGAFPIEHLPPSQLAHLAMRIAPSVRGRIIQAVGCNIQRAEPRIAARILEQVVSSYRRTPPPPSACSHLAIIQEQAGNIEAAVHTTRAGLERPYASVGFNLFILGMLSGSAETALKGADALNSWYADRPQAAEQFLDERRNARSRGQWVPQGEWRPTAQKISASTDGLARSLIHVLLD